MEFAGLAALALVGCVPYSLGTTAQTLPQGSGTMSATYSYARGGSARIDPLRRELTADEDIRSLDAELRFGLDERSDFGLRLVHLGGLSATVKRRHWGAPDLDEPAFATIVGGGVLSWGDYLHGEAAVVASGRDQGWGLPYGALRVLATVPTRSSVDWDPPIVGAHVGWRVRPYWRLGLMVLPELAAYYDKSRVPGRSDLVLVPSLTFTFGPRGQRPRFPPRLPPRSPPMPPPRVPPSK